MAKAQNKTTENNNSVTAFVKTIDAKRQKDCNAIIKIMQEQSGYPPKMWGPAIIGFGSYHYVYESGREGDAPLAGFSPRKNQITLYFSSEYPKREELLSKLGKHTTSKVCVYIKKLDDIDINILRKMITASIKQVKADHKC